jgi:rhomboid family GlyGly-CTERM serine protease
MLQAVSADASSLSPTAARAWLATCALLFAGALAGWFAPPQALDWQPALALREPWRWWTAGFVHLSPLHLGANLLATAIIAMLGHAAAVPARVAIAWLIAWPLSHVALGVLVPDLAHYAGLSGLLHGGVAAVAVHLVLDPSHGARNDRARRNRWRIGAAILVVLAVKLIGERPWGPSARPALGWDIPLAPMSHTTGAIAGALFASLAEALARSRRRRAGAAAPPAPR